MIPDLSVRQLRFGLLWAYVIHLAILSLYVLDILPQEFHRDGYPFWFHQGGDDYRYVALAHNILKLDFKPNKYPLGFPITLAPFMVLLDTRQHDDLLQPVAVFWSVVMFPLGQLLLAWIAERLTGRRWLALLSVLVWTALPLGVFATLRLVSRSTMAETYSVHLTWAQMLSDGPAALLSLAVLAALLRLRTSAVPLRWVALMGVLGGFLVMVRYTGALTVAVAGLVLILERRWREALLVVVIALAVFTPQLAYNWFFFDSPLKTGYTTLDDLPDEGLFAARYLFDGLEKAWKRAGWLLIAAGGVTLVGAVMGLAFLWRQERMSAVIVCAWLSGYLLVYSIYYYSWVGGLVRFLISALPAAAILTAAAIGALVYMIRPPVSQRFRP